MIQSLMIGWMPNTISVYEFQQFLNNYNHSEANRNDDIELYSVLTELIAITQMYLNVKVALLCFLKAS